MSSTSCTQSMKQYQCCLAVPSPEAAPVPLKLTTQASKRLCMPALYRVGPVVGECDKHRARCARPWTRYSCCMRWARTSPSCARGTPVAPMMLLARSLPNRDAVGTTVPLPVSSAFSVTVIVRLVHGEVFIVSLAHGTGPKWCAGAPKFTHLPLPPVPIPP